MARKQKEKQDHSEQNHVHKRIKKRSIKRETVKPNKRRKVMELCFIILLYMYILILSLFGCQLNNTLTRLPTYLSLVLVGQQILFVIDNIQH